MNDATRIRIAALVTALFIGLLTVGGLAVRPSHAPHAATVAHTQQAQPSFSELDDE